MENDEICKCAAIVCEHVANNHMPILYAERADPEDSADSGWQFLCGGESENWTAAQVWAIHEVLQLEPSLKTLIESPSGTVLIRKTPADQWQ